MNLVEVERGFKAGERLGGNNFISLPSSLKASWNTHRFFPQIDKAGAADSPIILASGKLSCYRATQTRKMTFSYRSHILSRAGTNLADARLSASGKVVFRGDRH